MSSNKIPMRFIDLRAGTSVNDKVTVSSYGLLLNHLKFKKKLSGEPYNYEFKSSTINGTTAEVIALMLHKYMSIGFDLPSAATMTRVDLKGTYSFIASDVKKNVMVGVKHGEPVIVFKNDDGCYLTMDVHGLRGKSTGEIYFLDEGELVLVNGSEVTIHDAELSHDGIEIPVDFLPYDPENEIESLRHAAHVEAKRICV